METLHIPAGKDTPEVYFGPDINMFQIEGISYPANPMEFYNPVFMWLHDFFHSAKIETPIDFNFKLDYFNTSSLKHFTKLLRIIGHSPACDYITVNWFYDEEDTDMLDAGKRLKQFAKTKFEFKRMEHSSDEDWNIDELLNE